jgi:hypothetical protein
MERHVLEKFFHMINDPRSYRNQKHPFQTLIGVSFLAILSGIDRFNGMAEFTEAKFEIFSKEYEDVRLPLRSFANSLSSPVTLAS